MIVITHVLCVFSSIQPMFGVEHVFLGLGVLPFTIISIGPFLKASYGFSDINIYFVFNDF